MLIGKRTTWHQTSSFHWELRRLAILDNYVSPTRFQMLTDVEELFCDSGAHGQLWWAYKNSCSDSLTGRFNFYDTALHAGHYRRTSAYFSMTAVDEYTLGAYASPSDPNTIFLRKGSIYAMEEACHLLLTFRTRLLIGLSEQRTDTPEAQIYFFREALQRRGNAFLRDYTAAIETPDEAAVRITSWRPNDKRPLAFYRGTELSTLPMLFCAQSQDLARQMFADQLSVLATMWLVSHEDAHRYMGHLRYFESTNLHVAGKPTFDELLAFYVDEDLQARRISAELDADTMAALRMVDNVFDSEFLGIFSDFLPPPMRKQLWADTSESGGLKLKQRMFLLRLANAACVIPLLVFELGFASQGASNRGAYPTLLTRAINTMFMIASRAVDITIHHPEYGIAGFPTRELGVFFHEALVDLANFCHVLGRTYAQAVESAPPLAQLDIFAALDKPRLAQELYWLFMIYHGQGESLGLGRGKLSLDRLDTAPVLRDFLVTKLMSHQHAAEDFASARLAENTHRPEVVEEDCNLNARRTQSTLEAVEF